MCSTKPAAATFLAALVSQTASAADWEYCLAPSNNEQKVYVSEVFETVETSWDSDALFDRALARAGLRHHAVQCPRADAKSAIIIMRYDAVAFNDRIGREVIYVRWKPAK